MNCNLFILHFDANLDVLNVSLELRPKNVPTNSKSVIKLCTVAKFHQNSAGRILRDICLLFSRSATMEFGRLCCCHSVLLLQKFQERTKGALKVPKNTVVRINFSIWRHSVEQAYVGYSYNKPLQC